MPKIWQQITPESWCRNATARDDIGKSVAPFSSYACQWCALGWIIKIYPDDIVNVIRTFNNSIGLEKEISKWNDFSAEFEEVREAFKKADL